MSWQPLILDLLLISWGVFLGWWFYARPKSKAIEKAKALARTLEQFELNPGEIEAAGQTLYLDEFELLNVRTSLAAWRLYLRDVE